MSPSRTPAPPTPRGEADWAAGVLGTPPGPTDHVGPYEILRLVGTGGMASVYEARDAQGSSVALKILNPTRVLPEDVKRFTREFRALAQMDHDHIVRVYGSGIHDGYPWIAMEFVAGTDLETEIASWRESDPADRFDRITRILRGLCRGLAYVHDLGLVHRDLKPSNVLLAPDGEPKISDFGVVKADGTSTQLTLAGRLVGTVAFMAPELITDEAVDNRADLYGLGAVLYLMCTFHRPIEADTVAGYLAKHLTEIPRPIGELEPRAPQILERICARLLQKDPALRYPNAQAVLQNLERTDAVEPPPLRGCDDLLQQWTRALLHLQEGAGIAMALHGDRGMGKTHLLDTLVAQAQAQGIRVAQAHRGAALLPQLAAGLGGQGATVAEDVEVHLRQDHPTVLAIDDLDRADPDDVRELARLVRTWVTLEARPLLLVFTTATVEGQLAALLDGTSTGLPCTVLPVDPIDARSTIALVRDRGITGPVAPALGRRLHDMYHGVPGAMVHQIDALVAHGWLDRSEDGLRPARGLEAFRRGDLPVPDAARERIHRTLDALDPGPRRIVEILAVLDRPASAALLEHCRSEDPATPRIVDDLVAQRILYREQDDQQERLALADPCACRVVRSILDPATRRNIHGVLAHALMARRRRASALEVAGHLEASGDLAAAWPSYAAAAQRSAREGRHSEVIEICRRARAIEEDAVAGQPVSEILTQRRWLALLQGEALLCRRAWAEAMPVLEGALADARQEDDPSGIARCLGALGRACFRQGAMDRAAPLLRDALQHAEPGAPDRAGIVRTLADLEQRAGRLDVADGLWHDALEAGVEMGSRDAEARARRGLAHLRALQGNLAEAAELLTQADDLLNPDGDYRVRAGVLTRAIELDAANGRLGSALYRAELLLDLAQRHGMGDRMPDALALLSRIHVALGRREDARHAARQAVVFANAAETAPWQAQVRAARTYLDLDQPAEAADALPRDDDVPDDPIADPRGQLIAVRARLAVADPDQTRRLCDEALARPPARLFLSGASLALDAARALVAAGAPQAAAAAASRGLDAIQGRAAEGMILELLLTLHRATGAAHLVDAVQQTLEGLEPLLPPHDMDKFHARPEIRRVVESGSS